MLSQVSKLGLLSSNKHYQYYKLSQPLRRPVTSKVTHQRLSFKSQHIIITNEIQMTSRVLSIQSHVVHGYVGNKCAAFCLQRLGFEVDVINTVQFSNHTGYPHITGTRLTGSELVELKRGLQENQLVNYTHVLTGYIGRKEALEATGELVREFKEECPNLVFVCDPVMGDDGQLYTPQELLEVYQTQILPIADILLPNQFEAELLTKIKITDIASAQLACQKLHSLGPHTIILTSLNDPIAPEGQLTLYCSTMRDQKSGHYSMFKIHFPKLECSFTGSGDLLASLLLALIQERPMELDWACQQAVSRIHGVLTLTYNNHNNNNNKKNNNNTKQNSVQKELELIRGQNFLVKANDVFNVCDCSKDSPVL
eukprot:g5292.t1